MKSLAPIILPILLFFLPDGMHAQISFEKHQIGAVTNPYDVFVVDLDLDLKPDVLTAGSGNGGEIRWWRNTGNGNFSASLIATQITNPRSVRGGDIDLDGDIDIIAALYGSDQVTWWENDGSQNFTRHDIANGFDGAHTVELCDLDKDGDIDVLCCEFDNSAAMSDVAWWENDGQQNWTKHTVSSRFQQATFVYGADMDNDGDNDLIACGELNGEVVWWENDGHMNWTEAIIDNAFPMAHTILPRDFDKDGDLDILAHACMSSKQAWYENRGSGVFVKHNMEDLAGAIWLEQGDFDRDGDNDLVGTGMGASSLVCYENNGRQALEGEWLAGGLASGFALNVVDMDGDSDLDVVAIGFNSNTLAWWENVTEPAQVLNKPKWISRDPVSKAILISNEENGQIGRVGPGGDACLIRSDFPVSTCLILSENLLWVNAATELVALDPISGVKHKAVRLPVQFLAGLTSDQTGQLYVSDPLSSIILQVDPQTGQSRTLTTGLAYPQYLYYDPFLDKLIVLDGETTISIKIIDSETGAIESQIETNLAAGGAITGDGIGNYYLSIPNESAIYILTNGMEEGPVLYNNEITEPYGMSYLSDDQMLLVVSHGENRIVTLPATATGIMGHSLESISLKSYPNPFTDELHIELNGLCAKSYNVLLHNSNGKLIWHSQHPTPNTQNPTHSTLNLAPYTHLMAPGIYFLTLRTSGKAITKQLTKN